MSIIEAGRVLKRQLVLAVFVVLFLPSAGVLVWVEAHAQMTSSGHLLAFAVTTAELGVTETSSVVYLFDAGDGRSWALGRGQTVSWSPSGRYLAAVNAGAGYGASGTITDFTVWDMDTGAVHWRRVPDGYQLSWSPEGDYLLLYSVSYIGSHAYEGSLAILALTNTGFIERVSMRDGGTRMTGMSMGVAPIGWTSDNRLLIGHDSPFATRDNPNGRYSLVDPASGEQGTVAFSALPPTGDLPPLWPGTMTAVSPDGRLNAAAVNPPGTVGAGRPSLSLTDLETGIIHRLHLPDGTILVQGVAWRPRSTA